MPWQPCRKPVPHWLAFASWQWAELLGRLTWQRCALPGPMAFRYIGCLSATGRRRRPCCSLVDGQIDQRLVEQLIADFAEGERPDEVACPLAGQAGVQIVEDAVARKGNVRRLPRQGLVKALNVVIHRCRNAVLDTGKNRCIELDPAGRLIDALDADVDQCAAIVGNEWQAGVDPVGGEVVGELARQAADAAFIDRESAFREDNRRPVSWLEQVDD